MCVRSLLQFVRWTLNRNATRLLYLPVVAHICMFYTCYSATIVRVSWSVVSMWNPKSCVAIVPVNVGYSSSSSSPTSSALLSSIMYMCAMCVTIELNRTRMANANIVELASIDLEKKPQHKSANSQNTSFRLRFQFAHELIYLTYFIAHGRTGWNSMSWQFSIFSLQNIQTHWAPMTRRSYSFVIDCRASRRNSEFQPWQSLGKLMTWRLLPLSALN